MRRLALALALAAVPLAAARAEEVVAALSQDRVSIATDFDGSDILVFGAIVRDAPAPEAGDLAVIVTVSGPRETVTVRRKARRGGIWVNARAAEILNAPSFYAVASSAPLAQALDPAEDARWRVSTARAVTSPGMAVVARATPSFLEALVRVRTGEGRYATDEGAVELRAGTLFSTEVALPANVTEGNYTTRILLTRGGRVIDSYETSIFVRKVGLERWLYARARRDPLLYGLMSLAIAVAAGWGASALFRAIRA